MDGPEQFARDAGEQPCLSALTAGVIGFAVAGCGVPQAPKNRLRGQRQKNVGGGPVLGV